MEELVKKAINKDENAFDKLIIQIEKELYIIAKSRLKDEDDIADALQETILKCYSNIHKLKNYSFFKTWTIRILINECNKIWDKKKKYRISIEDEQAQDYLKTEDDYDNLNFFLLIKQLNKDEKIILTMYYCLGYTTKQISIVLNKNENTIRSKMTRAKNKLKKNFEGGNEI